VINALHHLRAEADCLDRLVCELTSRAAPCTPDIAHTVESAVMRQHSWETVQSGMGALTPGQRDLLHRCYVDGNLVSIVATACDCSQDCIRHRLGRLYRRLESVLIEQGETEDGLRFCLPSATVCYCRPRGREGNSDGA
jgi:DNA-directed RNA polymerase specialized sigma24 family protein